MIHYASQTSATIIQNSAAVPYLPKNGLLGNNNEVATIQSYLRTATQILITGESGIGKTALASHLAATHLEEEHGIVLWLTVGDSVLNDVYEAITRPFRQQQLISTLEGGARIQFLHHLLFTNSISYIVLDDVQQPDQLTALLPAIPVNIPLILTSRQSQTSLPVKNFQLSSLSTQDSIEVLQSYAKKTFSPDQQQSVEELCQRLVGHPLWLRLVGRLLSETELSPALILDEIDADDPKNLAANIIKLLTTYLDEPERQCFEAMGGFFTPDVSAELLALYLLEMTSISAEQIADIRTRIPSSTSVDDTQLHDFLLGQAVQTLAVDIDDIQVRLAKLKQYGLIEEIQASDVNVPFYRLQHGVYEFLSQAASEASQKKAIDACLMLLRRHNESNLSNFAALRPMLKNLHKAAEWAMQKKDYQKAERFAWDLYANSQFLDYRGYYRVAIRLLTIAVEAAEKLGKPRNRATHLQHLGMCYRDMECCEQSAQALQQSLSLFQNIGDTKSEVTILALLGDTYRMLQYFDQALETYRRALALSRELNDPWGQSKSLANIGRSLRRMGKFEEAIDHIEQSLAISRGINDQGGEGNMLRYLGNIYREMKDAHRAVAHYMQALTLARDIGDRKMEANILGNLGEVYLQLHQDERADGYYHEAYYLYTDIEDMYGVLDVIAKIAHLALASKEYDKALDRFEEALAISANRGDIRQEAITMWSIATVYEAMGETEKAKTCFADVQALYDALELGELKKEGSSR